MSRNCEYGDRVPSQSTIRRSFFSIKAKSAHTHTRFTLGVCLIEIKHRRNLLNHRRYKTIFKSFEYIFCLCFEQCLGTYFSSNSTIKKTDWVFLVSVNVYVTPRTSRVNRNKKIMYSYTSVSVYFCCRHLLCITDVALCFLQRTWKSKSTYARHTACKRACRFLYLIPSIKQLKWKVRKWKVHEYTIWLRSCVFNTPPNCIWLNMLGSFVLQQCKPIVDAYLSKINSLVNINWIFFSIFSSLFILFIKNWQLDVPFRSEIKLRKKVKCNNVAKPPYLPILWLTFRVALDNKITKDHEVIGIFPSDSMEWMIVAVKLLKVHNLRWIKAIGWICTSINAKFKILNGYSKLP